MLNWKKKLHSSLRSMELGFSGSQVEWIDVFIETLLSKQKKEIIEAIRGAQLVNPLTNQPDGFIRLEKAIKTINDK
jgi:hypothetical protein